MAKVNMGVTIEVVGLEDEDDIIDRALEIARETYGEEFTLYSWYEVVDLED